MSAAVIMNYCEFGLAEADSFESRKISQKSTSSAAQILRMSPTLVFVQMEPVPGPVEKTHFAAGFGFNGPKVPDVSQTSMGSEDTPRGSDFTVKALKEPSGVIPPLVKYCTLRSEKGVVFGA